MKKRLVGLLAVLSIGGILAGCGNQDLFDTNYTYDKAIIELANGEVVEVEVKQWCDYDGEQIQVIAKDGTVYLTSSFRCDLINTKE